MAIGYMDIWNGWNGWLWSQMQQYFGVVNIVTTEKSNKELPHL